MKHKFIFTEIKYDLRSPCLESVDNYISYINEEVQNQIALYKKNGWELVSSQIDMDHYYDYGDEGDHLQLILKLKRLETDKELQARINRSERAIVAAQKRKEKKEQQERKLLKMLKDKYEN